MTQGRIFEVTLKIRNGKQPLRCSPQIPTTGLHAFVPFPPHYMKWPAGTAGKMQKSQRGTSRTRPKDTTLPLLSPGSLALSKGNSHVVRNLEQPVEASTGRGTRPFCQQPALTGQPPRPNISEVDPPAQDYRSGWVLTITSSDTSHEQESSS